MADPATIALALSGVLGPFFGANAAKDANRANLAASQADIDFRKNVLFSGQKDPFGNIINRKEGDGPFTTELFGDTKRLADTGLSNALQGEGTRGEFGNVARLLADQFRQGAPQVRAPLSLEDAMGIVGADNDRLKSGILEPALSDAAAIDLRTRGNTSNAGNLVSRFQERILPQINLNQETKALDLQAKDRSRFTGETLNLGEGALNVASGGFNPQIPGVANLGEIGNATNAIPSPAAQQPNFLANAFASGAGNVGNLLLGQQDKERAQGNLDKFFAALAARNNPATTGSGYYGYGEMLPGQNFG